MSKRGREESLADKIAGVLNATPAVLDPEDDDLDNTRAQIVNAETYEDDDNETEEILLKSFRKKNADLLEDFDDKSRERYKGVKASRKDFYESDEDHSDSNNSYVDEEESNDVESDNEKNDESNEELTSSDDSDNHNSESESDIENSEQDELIEEDANLSGIKTMNETNLSAQVKKGLCVRNQMQIWENLLEMRIQLQKSLVAANKLPQGKMFATMKNNSGKEFSDQLVVTKNTLANVLDKFLLLQKLVLNKYPETKKLDKHDAVKEDDDEEIPSDTDEEKAGDSEEEEGTNVIPTKKRKLNDIAEELKSRHDKYKSYRNSVIQKWNEKTRITMVKNNSNTSSVLSHIDHILSDRDKLIKKTQLKRSDYTIIGQERVENEPEENENEDVKQSEEYNTEIYDDDDFYHQLLRELIEVKSADVTDPVQLSRQWIQLQNLRSKMKRKIDTRATKGRKIRYAVHTKLVNFMAPIDNNLWTEEAKNELFSSLFGKLERVTGM